jgi:hypothetical protein
MAYPSRIEKFDPVVDDSHHTPPVGQNASKVSPAPAVSWMPWVVVGAKPIPIVTVLVAMFWTRRNLREVLVTALVKVARLAVTTEPKRVVSAPDGMAPTVTVPETGKALLVLISL